MFAYPVFAYPVFDARGSLCVYLEGRKGKEREVKSRPVSEKKTMVFFFLALDW